MSATAIPFLDMVGLHTELEEEFIEVLRSAVRTGHFVGGAEVEAFEREFAGYVGSAFCVGVSSGTDALRFALMAGGVEPGSLAVTVPNTFIATVEAISQAGAKVAFVDVDPDTLNMSPAALARFLGTECRREGASGKTVHLKTGRPIGAIVPVHLYGQPAALDELADLANAYAVPLYEDACQAHGSEYFSKKSGLWRRAGTAGIAAGFSFYPGKNLGALGEGGAVTTDDPLVAKKVRLLREHGSEIKYYHEVEGYNGRLDAIQAGFLRRKLRRLEAWNEARRTAAALYSEELADIAGVSLLTQPEWARSNYHLYIIRTSRREALKKHLESCGIGTGLHYPLPLHLQEAYRQSGFVPGQFPVAEAAAQVILSLPMFPGITEQQQARVVDAIRDFFEADDYSGAMAEAVFEPISSHQ